MYSSRVKLILCSIVVLISLVQCMPNSADTASGVSEKSAEENTWITLKPGHQTIECLIKVLLPSHVNDRTKLAKRAVGVMEETLSFATND
ncbi:hypothetical protein M8J76_001075 [Diaphorina citri]|nr:hypothetical protein M8J76_001075 [Diaphorina citri]